MCAAALAVLAPAPARAQYDAVLRDVGNLSFANISLLAGRGASIQRSENPHHSTLGVALGADFLLRRVIGTGQLRAKFLNQEEVRDPGFVCADRDCGPTHRLGMQADAYVDAVHLGDVGIGGTAGLLAFRGTLSTMVVEHPAFEKDLTTFNLGPSITWRRDAGYLAVAPVASFRHERTLGGDSFTGWGGGITGALAWIHGWFGLYADARYLRHPGTTESSTHSGDIYAPPPQTTRRIRAENAVIADADLRLRLRVGATSYVNLGGYLELTRSVLRFRPDQAGIPREFRDVGLSFSFEFLHH